MPSDSRPGKPACREPFRAQPGSPAPAALRPATPPPLQPLLGLRRPAGFAFPHVFPIMWNGLKTAVAGPYLGVTAAVQGSLPPPSLSPLSGRLFVGRALVVLTFVPESLIARGFLGSTPPAPGLSDLGRWLEAASTPCVWLHCPGWLGPGRAGLGAGSPSPTQAVAAGGAGGRLRCGDLRVRLPHLAKK